MEDSNPEDHTVGSEYSNVTLFEVDENGKYIITTPKYNDLMDTYFYGDYAAEKIKNRILG